MCCPIVKRWSSPRDGSAAYAEVIRQGAPEAVQLSDRWHLWHGLGTAVEKTVIAQVKLLKRQAARTSAQEGSIWSMPSSAMITMVLRAAPRFRVRVVDAVA